MSASVIRGEVIHVSVHRSQSAIVHTAIISY